MSEKIHENLEQEKWLVNCTQFAPHRAEQNPVENIWLQAKTFIPHFDRLCHLFKIFKWLFKFFSNGQIFDFPKLYECRRYLATSQNFYSTFRSFMSFV